MLPAASKRLLKGTIQNADAFNKAREEQVMWQQWKDSKRSSGKRRRSSEDDNDRPRRKSEKNRSQSSGSRKSQKRRSADSEPSRTGDAAGEDGNFWLCKLAECKEADPDKWQHDGFKALYPDDLRPKWNPEVLDSTDHPTSSARANLDRGESPGVDPITSSSAPRVGHGSSFRAGKDLKRRRKDKSKDYRRKKQESGQRVESNIMALESTNGEEPAPLDVEEGEIEDSGGSDAETEPAKSEESSRKPSKSSGTNRSTKPKEATSRKRTESSSDHGKSDSSRKGGSKASSSSSKNVDKKRGGSKFDEEKDLKRKAAKKAKEDTTFEDELNEYKQQQLNTSRSRRQSDDSDSADPADPVSNSALESELRLQNLVLQNARRPRPPRFQGNGPGRPFRRRREDIRPKEKKVPCKFFMEGRCKYGEECPFSHNIAQPRKLEACKFYMSGFCQKGNNCVYLHGEFPCKFFHTGQKCYAGDTCKFSHAVLSPDQKMALERLLEKENNFQALRHQARREEFERAAHKDGQFNGEAARDSKVFLDNLSKDLQQGDGHPQGPPGPWNTNSRRRPEFFRDTLPGGHDRRHSRDDDYPVPEGGPGEHSDQERYDDFPREERIPRPRPSPQDGNSTQDPGFSPGSQDPTSDVPPGRQDDPKKLPKKQRDLFMRLQQRAQQSASRQADGEDSVTEPISSESLEEGRARLTIEDAEPEEPERPKQVPQTSGSHWNDSDDEDDGSDQTLVANSLKRLQESPRASRWGPSHYSLNGVLPAPRAPYAHPPPNYTQPPPFPQNPPPFYSQQEPFYEPRPAQMYHAPDDEPGRRRPLLPLPPPGHEPVRPPLLAPPNEPFRQPFAPPPYQGGLLPPPVQHPSPADSQYRYEDSSWQYAQPGSVDPRSHPAQSPRLALLPHGPYPGSAPQQGVAQSSPFPGPHPHRTQQPFTSAQGFSSPPHPFGHELQPPQNYLPANNLTAADPRLQRHTGSVEVRSPSQELTAPPAQSAAPAPTPTLEAVLQKILAKSQPEAPSFPEVEAALSKNIDPPLYRLEPIEGAKPNMKEVYYKICAYRSIDELTRDPRMTKHVQTAPMENLDKLKNAPMASAGPAVVVEPEEPVENAVQEFDAYTAYLQEMLAKTKRVNEEPEDKAHKKRRFILPPAPQVSYSS